MRANFWLAFLALLVSSMLACTPAAPAVPVSPAAGPAPSVPRTSGATDVILATTTSTQDSGLLDVLVPLFERQSGYKVKPVSVGTGAALALGARGEADVVLVHAPESEKQWMAQGNGTERLLVMHNDFVVVGPPDDPARIRGLTSALEAVTRIAAAASPFVSRGDNSGTQQLELTLWNQAQITPVGQAWYIETGSGMGQTLTIADQKRAYTLTDRATWLTQQSRLQLPILVQDDRALFNVYHVMPVNPSRFPGVPINAEGGKAFADFMVAPATQEVIGAFGRAQYGQVLFVPDAGKRDEDLGL
jgi:tungstate transport system substrate-binding protein